MRAFYALPIPEQAQQRLWEALEPMRRASRGVAWVGQAQLHITLFFLGDIDEGKVKAARELLADAALVRQPFEVELQGLDRFPPRGRPRVLYARLAEGSGECISYYGQLAPFARAIVPEEGRSYVPHVTIGRVRRPESSAAALELGSGAAARFTVERCCLFESILRREGALYREIASVRFG